MNAICSVGGGDFSTTGVAKRPPPNSELTVQFSISLTSENKNKKRKDLIAKSKDIPSSTHSPQEISSLRGCVCVCVCLLPYFPGNGARNILMSTHTSIIVDYVGPPIAEVCRTAAI